LSRPLFLNAVVYACVDVPEKYALIWPILGEPADKNAGIFPDIGFIDLDMDQEGGAVAPAAIYSCRGAPWYVHGEG